MSKSWSTVGGTSTPLRCLLVDDDSLSVAILTTFIKRTPSLQVAGICTTALDALAFLRTYHVDVLFLDVWMPLLTGIDLLHLLLHHLPQQPRTIMVTSSTEHAVQAFDYAVVDYLVKPLTFDRFTQAVRKIEALALASPAVARPNDAPKRGDSYIFLKVDKKLTRVEFADIYYLEAFGSYVNVITRTQCLMVTTTLRALAERLPSHLFFQVHRSYLVNIQHIEQVADSSVIVMEKEVIISSVMRSQLLERLNPL